MLLRDLLAAIGAPPPSFSPDVTGIACDTRKLKPGNLFVAIRGHKADGHDFLPQAVGLGAVAVVAERPLQAPVPVSVVEDARRALALLADAFFGRPSDRVKVAGVTGTKGKTTTTYLFRSIVREAGRECGLLGTIAYEAFGRSKPSDNTTPDPLEIQEFLASLDRPDCLYAAIEVSSHALSQRRVDGVRFAAAAFTNLSGEHLDYHKTMEDYLEAKARLFDSLGAGSVAVLNAGQRANGRLAARTRARVLRYAAAPISEADEAFLPAPEAEIWADEIRLAPAGTRFRLHLPGCEPQEVALRLLGRHNVENALAAAGLASALGFEPAAIVRGLESLALVPGRLEPVEAGQPFRVLVDYAHTDDALEKVLTSLRTVAPRSRLICVFGCGGERDRTKRPRMGRVVERLADLAVVTSDNPRTEDPAAIIDEILAGLEHRERAIVEPDRRKAIARALGEAHPEDVVLIAGKGHETYQILGERRVHFDDREVARELLAK